MKRKTCSRPGFRTPGGEFVSESRALMQMEREVFDEVIHLVTVITSRRTRRLRSGLFLRGKEMEDRMSSIGSCIVSILADRKHIFCVGHRPC